MEDMSDLISRQAAIDMFQNLAYDDWNQGVSTTWANAFAESADMIEDLPSAQPEREKGKWLDVEHAPNELWYVTCSVCGERQTVEVANFCPMCGAEMVREAD